MGSRSLELQNEQLVIAVGCCYIKVLVPGRAMMMGRRRAGDLRLPGEPAGGRSAVEFMGAGCHEVPAFGRQDPQRPTVLQLDQHV